MAKATKVSPSELARRVGLLQQEAPDRYELTRLVGHDNDGDPIYSANGAMKALQNDEPGTFVLLKLTDEGQKPIFQTVIGADGERVDARRGRGSDTVDAAVAKTITAASETWERMIVSLERQNERLEKQVERYSAEADKLRDQLRAVSDGDEGLAAVLELGKEAFLHWKANNVAQQIHAFAQRVMQRMRDAGIEEDTIQAVGAVAYEQLLADKANPAGLLGIKEGA